MSRHALLVLALAFAVATEARAAEFSSRLSLIAGNEDVEEREFSTSSLFSLGVLEEIGGGLVLEAGLDGTLWRQADSVRFGDRGSYLRVGWTPSGWGEREGLAVTLLPLHSSRLHLGYEEPATWVGSAAPGAELRLSRERWYAYAAASSTSGHDYLEHEPEGLWTWMAGAGGDLFSRLWLEAVGLVSDRGLLPTATSQEQRAKMSGISGRALFHHGAPIGPSVDFSLLSTRPEAFGRFTDRESYPGGLAATVSLEASHRADLVGESATNGAIVVERSNLVDLVARVKRGNLRLHALGLFRSARFDVHPALQFVAMPKATEANAELLAKVGADYHFAPTGLTPGLVLGLRRPSSFYMPDGAGRFVKVRRDGVANYSSVPDDKEVQPVLSTQLTLRWDWGEKLSALGEVSWAHDPTRYVASTDYTSMRFESLPDDVFGGYVLLQVRL